MEECAQQPRRRDPGQSWNLRAWSGFSSLLGTSSRKPLGLGLGLGLGLLVLPHIPTRLSTFIPAVCSSAEWTLACGPGQGIIACP